MHLNTFLQSSVIALCAANIASAIPAPEPRNRICNINPNACIRYRDVEIDFESRTSSSPEMLSIRNTVDGSIALESRKMPDLQKIGAQAKATVAKIVSFIPGIGAALSKKLNVSTTRRDFDEENYEIFSRGWDSDDILEMRDSVDLEERDDWLEFEERDELLDELD